MIDQSDNTTRMYPQATLKQFTRLKPKPDWLEYDIIAQFNSDNNWYYSVSTIVFYYYYYYSTELVCLTLFLFFDIII